MPQRVTWNLQYVTRTEDQLNMMRHHFETFRHDPHVDSVELVESEEVPHLSIMTVAFSEDRDQPATRELQFMDRRYPVQTMARVEHQIQVGSEVAPTRAPPRFFTPPRIVGMETEEFSQRMQEAARALREAPSIFGLPAGEGGLEVQHPANVVPEWLKVGHSFISHTRRNIVTVTRVRDVDAVPTIGFVESGEPGLKWMILAEFLDTFEPYVAPVAASIRARTSWARLLENDDD